VRPQQRAQRLDELTHPWGIPIKSPKRSRPGGTRDHSEGGAIQPNGPNSAPWNRQRLNGSDHWNPCSAILFLHSQVRFSPSEAQPREDALGLTGLPATCFGGLPPGRCRSRPFPLRGSLLAEIRASARAPGMLPPLGGLELRGSRITLSVSASAIEGRFFARSVDPNPFRRAAQ
jgi:hypothetical protein